MERRETRCDQLIDDIYDAGARPDQWPATLSSIGSAAGAKGAIMFGFSSAHELVFEYNGALDDACAKIFKARHANNAWVQAMAKLPANQLVVSESILKLRELKRTEFYDEVLRPQQIGHAALASLTFGTDLQIQFSVQKKLNTGPFRPKEEILLRRLIPHIRRAIGVSLRLRSNLSNASNASNASNVSAVSLTERMECAAFMLCCRGDLVDANHNAWRLATGGGSFRLSSNGVRFAVAQEQERLLTAMKRVLDGAALQTMVLRHGPRRFDVAITGFRPGEAARPAAVHGRAAAVLMLVNEVPAAGAGSLDPIIVESLTAAEWRVAKVAALGTSNLEMARILNLSKNTVKTHLRHIYQKLNVCRQAELVHLLSHDTACEASSIADRSESHPVG